MRSAELRRGPAKAGTPCLCEACGRAVYLVDEAARAMNFFETIVTMFEKRSIRQFILIEADAQKLRALLEHTKNVTRGKKK